MIQSKMPQVLFLENRSITDIWSGVAGLIRLDFDCQLFRFNRSFGKSFPGKIVDLAISEQSAQAIDSLAESFIRTVFQTDRAAYLHGASEPAIRRAILSVFETLGQIEFDVVIGEVTSVYERAVEFYCRNKGIVFLAPMTARIPPNRFLFLDGSVMFPLPIMPRSNGQDLICDAVKAAQRNAGNNDLAVVVERRVRRRNSLRTLSGWLNGERLHTPSPLRKISLMWRLKRAKSRFAAMRLVGSEEIDSSSVIYCMHVQPESTLDTYSPELWDQSKIVSVIAEACQSAQRPFYVRPHPRGRHEVSLHMAMLQSPGVRILSPQVGMQDVLRRRPTVVTVSGTVLLEAAAAGVPTVALGRTYLSTFPGVAQISLADFSEFITTETVTTPPAAQEAQREWFESVNCFSHQGLISPPEWSNEALSSKNLSDIAAGVSLAVRWCLQPKIADKEKDR